MENYEVLSVAGEGSYGIVMKCRQKNTRKIVAIKKLIDIENDHYVKKMAFREIRILKVGPVFYELKLFWQISWQNKNALAFRVQLAMLHVPICIYCVESLGI